MKFRISSRVEHEIAFMSLEERVKAAIYVILRLADRRWAAGGSTGALIAKEGKAVDKLGEPGLKDLWFLPLGGCGEIGMNLNLIGHDSQWLMVDCGVNFSPPKSPGGDPLIEMPKTAFIDQRKASLMALLVTHAHEDHIGAISRLWHRWKCPLVATPFAAEVIKRRALSRDVVVPDPIVIASPGNDKRFGSFTVRWISMNHSTPETCGLEIETAAGRIFHAADWKIDKKPVLGREFNVGRYETLGRRGVDAMISDSTNVFVDGESPSEGDVSANLIKLIKSLDGRVIVSCFSSNIARLISLIKAGMVSDRRICLVGRSVAMMVACAKSLKMIDGDLQFIDQQYVGYLPRDEVLVIATGSQGESGSGLSRLSMDTHRYISLEKGDTVIFSSRTIPGNEQAVKSLRSRFLENGVAVVHAEDSDPALHATGHACKAELKAMYRLIRPRVVIPVHGDSERLIENARIASSVGVAHSLNGANGDLFSISPSPSVSKGFCEVGRVPLA